MRRQTCILARVRPRINGTRAYPGSVSVRSPTSTTDRTVGKHHEHERLSQE